MICAFIGHREIDDKKTVREHLTEIVKKLIVSDGVDTFLFGSRSEFNDISYEVVTELKETYTDIQRVYVRAEYEHIGKEYTAYLLASYDDTYFSPQAHNAGYKSYIKRNQDMIDQCDIVVAYCDTKYIPSTKTRSGTKMAVQYAQQQKKRIINIFDLMS